ncbi:hypothetical protein ACOMHN_014761 [Nucella lapillus]
MEAHRKFLKKHTRSRHQVYDEEKETLVRRTVERCKNKLDEYRLQGLKLALLEERRCYCFVLARLSSVATIQLYYHGRGADLLKAEVGGWKQLCSQPNILPLSADPLLHFMDGPVFQDSSSTTYTVYTPNEAGHSPYRHIAGPMDLQHVDYSQPVSSSASSDTISRSIATINNMTGAQAQIPGRSLTGPPLGERLGEREVQVRALHSHSGGEGSQLAFALGDLITLMGDPVDGWQFGQNARSGQYGWFPLSFTVEVPETRRQIQPMRYRQRAKSFSDLNGDVRSMSDLREWTPDLYNVPGTQLRPRSLYDPSSLITTAPSMPQLLAHPTSVVEGSSQFSIPAHNSSSLLPGPSTPFYIQSTRSQPASRAPSPPLPPPPARFMQVTTGGGGGGVGNNPSSFVSPAASGQPDPHSLFRHPSMRSVHLHSQALPMASRLQSSLSLHHLPVAGPPSHPPPHPPPADPGPGASAGGGGAGGGGGSAQMAGHFAASPFHNMVQSHSSPLQGQSRASSPAQVTQLDGFASYGAPAEQYHASEVAQPPPAPAPPPPPLPPPANGNGPFSAVTLRKTQTDDRSAPRIH